jgi:arylsulfatase A-like enzyme
MRAAGSDAAGRRVLATVKVRLPICGILCRVRNTYLVCYDISEKKILSLAIVLLIGLSGIGEASAPDGPPSRPNIILILTDDLDAKSAAYMPRLKTLLADRGTTFANFFVDVSLCCPSRASILRGQYAHNTRIFTNRPPDGGFERFRALGHENSTIATWLQAAGYRTVLLGKYLNGYPSGDAPTYIPLGWDEWYGVIRGHYFDYQINENGRIVSYGSNAEEYETDVLARKATDFIRRTAAVAPFFIYLAPFAPHGPATPAPRHQNAFAEVSAPRPPSFNEQEVGDKPLWLRNQPLLTLNQIVRIDELYRKRLQSLLAVDEMMATLIETLQSSGALENTYIFFTSDNGFHLGEHRLPQGKNTAYEEDIHVPLVVRGPNVPAGRALEHLAGNIDLAPTFAELAGAPLPDFVDGRSLRPLLGSNPPRTEAWRQALLIELGSPSQARRRRTGRPACQAVRTKEYLYVEYVGTGERELYNLHDDPYELQSSYVTADRSLLAALSSQLARLRECAGSSCRTAEAP